MKLKYKILLAVVPLLTSAVVCLNLSFGMFYESSFKKQERFQADAAALSLSAYIGEKADGYLRRANDWAHRDETYSFVKTGDRAYIARNLSNSTLSNLNVDFVIITDAQGRTIYQQHRADSAFSPLPAYFLGEFPGIADNFKGAPDSFGIFAVKGDLYLVAGSDITDTFKKKPPAGKLFFVRRLDGAFIGDLERITGCSIESVETADTARSGTPERGRGPLVKSEVSPDQRVLHISVQLPGGTPSGGAATFRLAMPRTVFSAVMKDVTIYSVLNTAAFAGVSLAIAALLGNLLAKPFKRLVEEIGRIDVSQGDFARLDASGRDEFAFMRRTINGLLDKIGLYQASLSESAERLRVTLMSIGDGVISVDGVAGVALMNPSAEALTGWGLSEAQNRPIEEVFQIVDEITRERVASPVRAALEGRTARAPSAALLVSKDGSERPVEYLASPIKDASGRILGCVLVFRDCSDRRERQRWMDLSYRDDLTGLYNRRFLEDELRRINVKASLPLSFVYADLNGLKIINDAFGHDAGDKLIRLVADLLKSECSGAGIAARVGGDEFVALLPRTDREAAKALVGRLKAKMDLISCNGIDVSVSLGWDTKEDPSQPVHDILRKAEDYMYRRKMVSGDGRRGGFVRSVQRALYSKCPREEAHAKRVGELCRLIGSAFGLPPDELQELATAGELHDVGKIVVDAEILNKCGPLTDDEWTQVMRHPETGYRVLGATGEYAGIAEYVLSHHERWDGKGYPRSLKAGDISWKARVIAVADAYDAMTSGRPYRAPIAPEEAAEEIRRCAGSQFDPMVAKVFIEKVLGLKWGE